MIVSINWVPGSGKSTMAKKLEAILDIPRIYGGQVFRNRAAARWEDLQTYLTYLNTHPDEEISIDNDLKSLCLQYPQVIFESRVWKKLLPESFGIFLDVEITEGARRIFSELMGGDVQRNEHLGDSLDQAVDLCRKRRDTDQERYQKLYGIDIYDSRVYDLVIDTTNLSPEEVLQKILDNLPK